jgi:hypothetical protein
MTELGTFEAAKEFHVHPVTLLNLIALGRLDARKNEYNRWRINRKSLEAWNLKRLERGQGKRRRAEAVREEQREAATAKYSDQSITK